MKFKKIYIEITNICNKNCSFCSISKRKKKEISPTSFEYIINQIKNYTSYIYLHVKGEPLIHSDLKKIINICNNNNINVNLTTNGSLLERNKDILSCNCIRQINISLQSYEKISNIEEIISIINTSKYLLMKNQKLNISYRIWAIKNNEFSTSNKIIIDVLQKKYNYPKQIERELIEKKNIKISERTYINIADEFDWPTLNSPHYNFHGTCFGTRTHIGILSDGTVIPCCLDSEGVIKLGNIFEKNLSEIISDERFVKLHNNILNNKFNEELCKHCTYKNRFNYKLKK